jgi:hypothetical protein
MHVVSLENEKKRYKHKVQAQKDGKKNMITASCSQNDRLKTDSDGGRVSRHLAASHLICSINSGG